MSPVSPSRGDCGDRRCLLTGWIGGNCSWVGDNSTSNGSTSTTTSTLLKPLLLLLVLPWMGETVSGLEEGRPLIKTEPPTNGDVSH